MKQTERIKDKICHFMFCTNSQLLTRCQQLPKVTALWWLSGHTLPGAYTLVLDASGLLPHMRISRIQKLQNLNVVCFLFHPLTYGRTPASFSSTLIQQTTKANISGAINSLCCTELVANA